MSQLIRIFPVVLGVACQSGAASLSETERMAVAASVDSATRSFEAAERARDAGRIIAHLAPDFYMYADGVRSGYDSVTANIRTTMESFKTFEPGFHNVGVIVLARDAAVVSMTFRDSITTASGETLQFRGPTTLVWQRRGADWLIVYADADHYAVPAPQP